MRRGTDKASVSAILATCLGSQTFRRFWLWIWSNVLRWARIRQAFLVSRQPSWCGARRDHVLARGCESVPHRTQRRQVRGLSGRWPRRRQSWDRHHDARQFPTDVVHHTLDRLAESAGHPRFSSPTQPARTNAFPPPRMSSAGSTRRQFAGIKPQRLPVGEKGPAAGRAIPCSSSTSTGPSIEVTVRFLKLSWQRIRHFGKELWPSAPRPTPPSVGLDLTTELLSEFVSLRFDHGIMTRDRTVARSSPETSASIARSISPSARPSPSIACPPGNTLNSPPYIIRCRSPARTLILRTRASRDSRAEGFLASRWVRMAQPETVWDKNVLYP